MSEPISTTLRIFRLPKVLACVGVSRSTVYNWLDVNSPQHLPEFPKPIRIGKNAVGWLEHEINEYIENKICSSRPEGATKKDQGDAK